MSQKSFLNAESFLKYRKIEQELENGDFTNIEFFLKHSSFNALNYALEWTAFHGNLHLLQQCVTKGADIHANNEISLQMACENNHMDIVKYLVTNGANINVLNCISFFRAIDNKHYEIAKYLLAVTDQKGNKLINITLKNIDTLIDIRAENIM